MRRYAFALFLAVFTFAASPVLEAQTSSFTQPVDTIPADLRGKIDTVTAKVLADTGVPSASIAIVQKGQIVYTNAYGKARLEPPTPAAPQMRYSIGSISKQFTAASILLLEQQGKLSIDDPVSKYIPGLTRGDEVTIRMLLSHTSGYQDYWPQDYLMPPMREATTSQHILDTWAKKPPRFRSRHQVAIFKYQLRHCRPDRRKAQWTASDALPAAECLHPARHEIGL